MFQRAGLVFLFLFLAWAFVVVAAPLPSDGLEHFSNIYNRGVQLVPYEFDESGDELFYARGTDFEDYALFERDYIPLDPQQNIERRGFMNGIGNVFKSAGRAVAGAVNRVTSAAKNVVNKATSAVKNTVKRVTSAAKNVVNKATSAVKNTAKWVGSTAKNVVNKATSAVKNTVKRVTSAARNVVNKATSAVKNTVQRVTWAAKNVVNKATSAVKNTVQRVTSTVKGGVNRVVSGVKNTVKGVTSAVKNGVSAVQQGIRKSGQAIKQGMQWVQKNGPTIAKVGLKAIATGEAVAAKFAPLIPEYGEPLAIGLKVSSQIDNAVSDAIPAKVPDSLTKTMDVLNTVEQEQ